MRIISGIYKGRNIVGHTIEGTRPTQDRIKENIFNIINENIKNKVILDLFAGSANLAIEALSRNAKYAYVSDNNIKSINIINKNIKNLNISNIKVLKLDYKKMLYYLKSNNIKIDIVFLDPPYDTNYYKESISLIEKYELLNEDGIIICETSSKDKIIYNKFKEITNKKYGDKYIIILKRIEG